MYHLAQIKKDRIFFLDSLESEFFVLRSNFLIVFYTLVGADKVTPTLLLVRIVVVLLPPAGGICTLQEKKEEFRPKRSSLLGSTSEKFS